jgi:hydrogenase maturation protease
MIPVSPVPRTCSRWRLSERIEADTLILALGNPLRGDDGIGLAILAALADRKLPAGVVLQDGGTAGLETVVLLEGYQRLLILDAADFDASPGSWRRFSYSTDLLLTQTKMQGTLHDAGLAEALQLAEALGLLPPEVVIFGVQPAVVGWEEGLSPAVAAVVGEVATAVQTYLADTTP